MSGFDCVADTNIGIYLLSGDEHLANLLQGADVRLSVITELELLSKRNITPAEVAKTKAFINHCTVIELTPAIKQKVMAIRQTMKLNLPDAIIAASAIVLNLPLITADKRLEKIPGLDAVVVLR